MKPQLHTRPAPSDAPGPRTPARHIHPLPQPTHTMNTSMHIHAEFKVEDDLQDIGAEFAGSVIHRIGFDFDGETGLYTLADVYGYRIFRAYRWLEEGELKWQRLILRFARDAYVMAFGCGTGRIIASTAAKAEALLAELTELLDEEPAEKEPSFYMLRYDMGSFTADAIDNLPDAVDDEFLRLAYGDDIGPWVDTFTSRTKERQNGLTILEGPPGTGKTSLVSEMIRRLRSTHLFYVLPVCNDGSLTAPELVSFWQGQHRQHPDRIKVVVMEDAERILLGRSPSTRDSVAAVLNIADGLIGRMLKLHLVCSTNAAFEELDPAIQRPGRLMNYRRFAPIARERAVALAAKQGTAFQPHPEVDEFTLAQVLQPAPAQSHSARRQIGFAAIARR